MTERWASALSTLLYIPTMAVLAALAFCAFGAVIVVGNVLAIVLFDRLVDFGLWRPLAGLVSIAATIALVVGGARGLSRIDWGKLRRR